MPNYPNRVFRLSGQRSHHAERNADAGRKLVVVSHKEAWPSAKSISGIATDGGFAFQMGALADLFDQTTVCVPIINKSRPVGEIPFNTTKLSVLTLPPLRGSGLSRKLRYPFWFICAAGRIGRAISKADLVHVPVPSDIGTAGLILALVFRKRLFVRYCGNWHKNSTRAERAWKRFMEWRSTTSDLMVATGGSDEPASAVYPEIKWLFSTSLTQANLDAITPPASAPSPEHLVLVHTARQGPAKGTDIVIQALPKLREAFPGVRFDVIGDGPGLDNFKTLAIQLGVSDITRFHGKLDLDGVIGVLESAHIFVMPTHSEGFPKAIVEALACGLPVVATALSVIPRLIDGCGIPVARPETDLVSDAVLEIASDPDRYMEMSRRAQITARAFTLEAWRDQIGEMLGIQNQ